MTTRPIAVIVGVGEGLSASVARFAAIRDYLAFYCHPMDRCLVDGVEASPQPGNFYGGWVTPWIVGPIKGAPGTTHW